MFTVSERIIGTRELMPGEVSGYTPIDTVEGPVLRWDIRTPEGVGYYRTGTHCGGKALRQLLRAVELPVPEDEAAAAAFSAEDVCSRRLLVRWTASWSDEQEASIRFINGMDVLPAWFSHYEEFGDLVEAWKEGKKGNA